MKLNQFFASITLTLGFSASALAETTSMWEVSKGEESVYVGGTVHILPASEFPLPTQFQEVYDTVDSLVLEVELPEPDDQQAQLSMLQAASYESGVTLSSKINEDTQARLNEYLSSMGVNIAEVDRFKPGFIVSMMVMMEAARHQMAGEGVDQYFKNQAIKDKKSLEYLESIEFQMHMLANQGKGEEDKLLNATIKDMPKFKQLLKGVIEAWRLGDETSIEALVIDKMKNDSPKSFDEMITKRNKNWVPLIEAMFNDEDTELVLVGVGHLVGEGNVLQLLEQKGYIITPVDSI